MYHSRLAARCAGILLLLLVFIHAAPTTVRAAETAGVSYPSFWSDLDGLGSESEESE